MLCVLSDGSLYIVCLSFLAECCELLNRGLSDVSIYVIYVGDCDLEKLRMVIQPCLIEVFLSNILYWIWFINIKWKEVASTDDCWERLKCEESFTHICIYLSSASLRLDRTRPFFGLPLWAVLGIALVLCFSLFWVVENVKYVHVQHTVSMRFLNILKSFNLNRWTFFFLLIATTAMNRWIHSLVFFVVAVFCCIGSPEQVGCFVSFFAVSSSFV